MGVKEQKGSLSGEEVLKHRLLAEKGRMGIALSSCNLDLLENNFEREGIWSLEVRNFGNRLCLINCEDESAIDWVQPWVKMLNCSGDVFLGEGSFKWSFLEGFPFHA